MKAYSLCVEHFLAELEQLEAAVEHIRRLFLWPSKVDLGFNFCRICASLPSLKKLKLALYNMTITRPVTPEVAGSSPVPRAIFS
jgi:hypothetical protein